MITIESQGEWKLTRNWFDRMTKLDLALIMNQFGKEGVSALAAATPSRSGLTSKSWNYEVTRKGNNWKITWTNSNRAHPIRPRNPQWRLCCWSRLHQSCYQTGLRQDSSEGLEGGH